MLELRIAGGAAVPLFDLPAMLGRKGAVREIGDTIESLIAFMDDLGGDPDLEDDERGAVLMHASGADASFDRWRASDPAPALDEEDGDEEDHNGTEDDFVTHWADGPGCPIADNDHGEEEKGEATSWPEWQTLRPADRRAGAFFGESRSPWGIATEEDDEEDDPAEDDSEDGCEAGDDAIYSGHGPAARARFGIATAIGSEDDAEPDSDTESNGDELDGSLDPNL